MVDYIDVALWILLGLLIVFLASWIPFTITNIAQTNECKVSCYQESLEYHELVGGRCFCQQPLRDVSEYPHEDFIVEVPTE